MRILAIDPGNEQSAYVVYRNGRIESFGKEPNETMLHILRAHNADELVVEMIASYGLPVGREVFDTCLWIGRFIEAWGGHWALIYRKDVKMHLCGQTKGVNDSVIRQALIDRFGPTKEKAIGKKSSPGPLYGMKADTWAALAVALTYAEAA